MLTAHAPDCDVDSLAHPREVGVERAVDNDGRDAQTTRVW